MNSSQIYKDTLTRKRTYMWSLFLALLIFAGTVVRGWYVEEMIIEEEEKILAEHVEEVYNPSHVPYESDFRRCAPSVGWDWELLAAVAYHESRFNPETVSPGGALGVMQLMPGTGQKFGLTDSTFFSPSDNIAAGCRYITRLQHYFDEVEDPSERTKFVLASYNAGPSHIYDAQALCRKYGADPNKWDDVEYFLSLLREEEYYRDPVVNYGSFRARQTLSYVQNTLHTYRDIRTGHFKMPKRAIPTAAAMIAAENAPGGSIDGIDATTSATALIDAAIAADEAADAPEASAASAAADPAATAVLVP